MEKSAVFCEGDLHVVELASDVGGGEPAENAGRGPMARQSLDG